MPKKPVYLFLSSFPESLLSWFFLRPIFPFQGRLWLPGEDPAPVFCSAHCVMEPTASRLFAQLMVVTVEATLGLCLCSLLQCMYSLSLSSCPWHLALWYLYRPAANVCLLPVFFSLFPSWNEDMISYFLTFIYCEEEKKHRKIKQLSSKQTRKNNKKAKW